MRTTKVQISLRIRYSRNFNPLASLCSWAGRFESYLVANPEDRFSRDEAQMPKHLGQELKPSKFIYQETLSLSTVIIKNI